MIKKKIAIVMVITAGLFLLNQPKWVLGEGEKPILPSQTKEKEEEKIEMKVNFYTLDRKKLNKGEFLGTVELKEGKLVIAVTDPELEKILKEPYITMTGEIKEGVAMDEFITYQPGTKEHLQAIAIECYRFGYIGEVIVQ